jgi:hypothetical protein
MSMAGSIYAIIMMTITVICSTLGPNWSRTFRRGYVFTYISYLPSVSNLLLAIHQNQNAIYL